MTPSETLSAAQATLASLEAQLDQIAARLTAIETERAAIAHAALTGDTGAREKLIALKRENAELIDTATDVESAIAQAQRDVAAAEGALAALGERERAKQRLALADQLEAEGVALADALREVLTRLASTRKAADELYGAGVKAMDPFRVEFHVSDAVISALRRDMSLGNRIRPGSLHPKERPASAAALVKIWATDIRADAEETIQGRKRRAPPETPPPVKEKAVARRAAQAPSTAPMDEDEIAALQAQIEGVETLAGLAKVAA